MDMRIKNAEKITLKLFCRVAAVEDGFLVVVVVRGVVGGANLSNVFY